MGYSRPVADIIRSALCDAIRDREAMLEGYAGMADDPDVPAIERDLADYRAMLKRRYGMDRTPEERPLGGRLVPAHEVSLLLGKTRKPT